MNTGSRGTKVPSLQAEHEGRMQAIIRYYDQTVFDYRVVWLNDDNRAIHFGYSDQPGMDHAQALVRLNEVMAEKGEIHTGDRVLDAGCGQGGSSMWMARNLGAQTTGISPVPGQIDKARRLSATRGLGEKCEFIIGDYRSTPFPDEHFDVVWACESVCHADQKIDFYKEACRILKPGGRLIIAEYLRTSRPLSQKGEGMIHSWLDGWAIRDIDTLEEHERHVREAGFGKFEPEEITHYMKSSLRRLFRLSVLLYPLAIFFLITGVRNKVQHRNVVASIVQYRALRQGFWKYYLLKAVK